MALSRLASAAALHNLHPASRPAFGAGSSSPDPAFHPYPSPTKESPPANGASCVQKVSFYNMEDAMSPPPLPHTMAASASGGSVSPRHAPFKAVAFELVFADQPHYRARLPLRIRVFSHDTTDSIVTTVKNFFGLYSSQTVSKGVSFEDSEGNTLIPRYENFDDNMTIYVRVFDELSMFPMQSPSKVNNAQPCNVDGFPAAQASHLPSHEHHVSRPVSRTSRKRSVSPVGGRRSASASTNATKKGRFRAPKNHSSSSQSTENIMSDSVNGYSSGDNAPGSSSGKNKEAIGNTEISLDNIVEGGRRKRAKFESSELPLFAPPQMPAISSNPSVSPARRMDPHRYSLPTIPSGQNPFTHPRPLQSPQNYNEGYGNFGLYTTPGADRRTRGSGSVGFGVRPSVGTMPTPDPTVGSCMSEEDKDVAIQLMRLGEISNVSAGRTSASTMDDTFSGKADAASSTGATSEAQSEDDEEPAARRQKLDATGQFKNIMPTTESHFCGPHDGAEASEYEEESDDAVDEVAVAVTKAKQPQKLKANTLVKPRQPSSKAKTSSKSSKAKAKRPVGVPGPSGSVPATARKASTATNGAASAGDGEDGQADLSTKPRCQRCRKSKKGCDRQRPCGRCADAGIPADQCISEDEGNGRKGRYGRHMGVPIAKEDMLVLSHPLAPPAPVGPVMSMAAPPLPAMSDKNKKRKR